MLMLPDISQWSTVGNYGYIRQDVYLAPKGMPDIDLLKVRLDKDYEVVQVSAHIPRFGMWVEFLESCPSKMPKTIDFADSAC